MLRVVVKISAQKNLKKIDRRYQARLVNAMRELGSDPFLGKPLVGDLSGFYSLRVWPYRIIYQLLKKEGVLFIVAIEHRQGAY